MKWKSIVGPCSIALAVASTGAAIAAAPAPADGAATAAEPLAVALAVVVAGGPAGGAGAGLLARVASGGQAATRSQTALQTRARAQESLSAQAQERTSARAQAGAPASGWAQQQVASAQLADARGGDDTSNVDNTAHVHGAVGSNTASNVTTGLNSISGGSFANSVGLPVVIQNSGANVLIQNSTIINLQLR